MRTIRFELTIRIDMTGVPPSLEHWQHFHGFKDNQNATCPGAAADANHDGIIDLIETGATAGTTPAVFHESHGARIRRAALCACGHRLP